ncbi:O-antigen biosynthesis protein [hydrothermal vent metagenome]|uniref:O-antigen biosynthesis protein n=1 Tax=hydrothermal vent metagenome TaxID=652676 RepID=A0A3B0Y9A1_9ZZZZ
MSRFDDQGSNLIFILSLPRSGSTLLQRILGGHSQIHTVAEPWLMLNPLHALRETGVEAEYDAALARQGLEDFLSELDEGKQVYIDAVRAYASRLYGAALSQSGKTFFLDKTPRYYHIIPELRTCFPKARFVFLLRNPAAVLSSTLRVWFDNDPERLDGTSNYQDLTEGTGQLADALADFGDEAIIVRYEDLVSDTEQTVETLCRQLNISFEAGTLVYGDSNMSDGRHGDQTRIHEHEKAVADYCDAWVQNLRLAQRKQYALDYIDTLGTETVERLGYDADMIRDTLRSAEQSDNSVAADAVNAEGEALFQSGDEQGALEKFEQALSLDEGFVLAYNNLAVLYWHQKNPEQAVIALSNGLSKQPRDRNLVITAGQIFAALGMKTDALALVSAYLADSPDDVEVEALHDQIEAEGGTEDTVAEVVVTEVTSVPAEPIAVITSIAPSRIDVQQRAVQSWIDQGFEVMSLNVQEEIDRLKADFPGVRFVRAKRDGRKRLGKPYVYVNDMFSALRQSGRQVVGVINSDIILRTDEGFNQLLCQEAQGSLLYGSRIDIDRIEDEAGRYYHRGFDLFFMDRDVLRDMPENGFMLGMPWWDYWFPCLMLTKGVSVKRIDNPGAYHLWHKPNYSTENSVSFGEDFVKVFAGLPFLHLHDQSIEAGLGGFRFSVLSDSALYHVARNSQRISLPVSASKKSAAGRNPKVTAIVSTYASEEFIGECLQDLVNQTIADEIEILVIDAASPQNERAVVEKFQQNHPNIRYHRTPERIGIYAAWNLAVDMANGDYLVSCSTNDRLRGDACEILSRALDDQPDVALVYGNSFLTKDPHRNLDNAALSSMYIWPEYRYETLLDRSMVGPHAMWRRSVHETVGRFDESLLALGDQDFWIRLGEQHKLLALPDFTGLYLVSDDSLTGNTDVSSVEEDYVHMRWSWRHRYEKWFKNRLEVPEAVRCQEGPPVQIVLRAANGKTNGIADTLDSVAEQAYSNWTLAVVSEEPCPDPIFDEHPQLAWIQGGPGSANDECIDALLGGCTDDACLVFMEAGERLDALFLSDACAGLERHPEWKMLYCDDDCVASDGELTDPRFKPDFNLDLLRSSDYVGNACVFRSSAVKVIGETGAQGDARAFDLLLRVFDQFGRGAIGHLAEMRFHRSVSSNPAAEASIAFRRRAVQAHLNRCGEQALIEDAVIPGAFMLSYMSDKKPKVSILVVASGSGGGVGNAVHSIMSKTDYPDYEIRILVGPSVPVAVIDRLQVLQKETPFIHLERCANKISPASLNQMARDCSGDLLLWLNENSLILQKGWLARLVATGQRDSVGVVGVRAVNRKKTMLGAGVIPGIGGRGAGSGMLSGLHMTSEGYMGRAQLMQETGAVSPLCMLVSKEDFSRAGEFDTALAVDLYRSIDFCERIRAEGLQVVWTPHVTLMYLGATGAIDGEPESEEQVDRETALLHERWLGQFAREPAFNRHLSLSRSDYGLDTAIPATWNPELDNMPRVLSFGVGSLGSWQYRVRQPLNAMRDERLLQCVHTEFAGKESVHLPTVVDLERLQPTTLLMHNTMHDDFIEAMEKYKRVNNAFIVFGQDDLMTALPPKNPFSKTVYKDMKQRVRKCLSLADRLVVTTEPLAQALAGMADEIIVVPNAIDESVWGSLESNRGLGRKPRVGWAGAQQHLGDLEMLETVVRELADEVEWVFFGMCPPALLPWVSEVHQAVDFELYPEKLASLNLDLALAPLERNRFNESKSNLRVLEYGVLGWPVIATDIHPYQSAPVCRVPNQPRAWINAIRERIHDCNALAQDGDQLREWVYRNAMLGQQLDAWMSALNLVQSDAEVHHHHGHAANL